MSGWHIRTTVLVLAQQLQPHYIHYTKVQQKDLQAKWNYCIFYNRCHSTPHLSELRPGQLVKLDGLKDTCKKHCQSSIAWIILCTEGLLTCRNWRQEVPLSLYQTPEFRACLVFHPTPCPQGSCIGGPANQLWENLGQRNQLAMGKQLYPLGVWKYALFRVNGEIVVNFDLFGIHAWIIGKIYLYCWSHFDHMLICGPCSRLGTQSGRLRRQTESHDWTRCI